MNNKLFEAKQYKDMREVLNGVVSKYPSNIAFTIKTKRGANPEYRDVTFREFKSEVDSFATGLIKLGLKNKRVAVIGKNSYEWAVTYFAVLSGVGIIVPLDKGLPEQEIEDLMIRSEADAIVFENAYLETMMKIKSNKSTKIKNFICMANIENDEVICFNNVVELGKEELKSGNKTIYKAKINPESASVILFTSGTTSISKAVLLSQKNLMSDLYGIESAIKVFPNDVNMAFLPFHHCLGAIGLITLLNGGAKVVFCDGLRYISQNLKEYKVTVFFCVPLILESMHKKIIAEINKKGLNGKVNFAKKLSKILMKFGIDVRRRLFKTILDNLGGGVRLVVSGAAAIDRQVVEDFNAFGILTIQGYGLTETSPVLCVENEKSIRYGSIGFPLCNVDVKIDNPNEEGIGEVIAKGPMVMLGYYNNQEATNEVLKDGWFHTGDLGYIDSDGYVFLTGRVKNVIVLKNGKNVYPEELEILISGLPYVLENMVFGIPEADDDLMLAVKLVYNEEMFANMEISEVEKRIWADIKEINNSLTTYKHIKKLIITTEPMTKTTTNKVKRNIEISKTLETLGIN